ncbi:hypothetical protein GCM10022207_33390 [Streptomyces lannensis]|uniref:Uncharacterized protein n=1 Tax=Streptomyces lannensis TaxID=766498 RepID=A0ABP7K5H4_9ACTN
MDGPKTGPERAGGLAPVQTTATVRVAAGALAEEVRGLQFFVIYTHAVTQREGAW